MTALDTPEAFDALPLEAVVADREGFPWRQYTLGEWYGLGQIDDPWTPAQMLATAGPFTRLVPELAPVTTEQVRVALGGVLFNVSNYPERAQVPMLGQDFTPLLERATAVVMALLRPPQEPPAGTPTTPNGV